MCVYIIGVCMCVSVYTRNITFFSSLTKNLVLCSSLKTLITKPLPRLLLLPDIYKYRHLFLYTNKYS